MENAQKEMRLLFPHRKQPPVTIKNRYTIKYLLGIPIPIKKIKGAESSALYVFLTRNNIPFILCFVKIVCANFSKNMVDKLVKMQNMYRGVRELGTAVCLL